MTNHTEIPRVPTPGELKKLSQNFALMDEEEREQLLQLAQLLADRSIERRDAVVRLKHHGLMRRVLLRRSFGMASWVFLRWGPRFAKLTATKYEMGAVLSPRAITPLLTRTGKRFYFFIGWECFTPILIFR